MRGKDLQVTLSVSHHNGRPVIESRVRALDGTIPRGKVLVMRTPVLPPGATDEAIRAGTVTELEDDG